MFRLTEREFPIDIPGIDIANSALKAVPNGSGRINVVDNFRWKNAGSTDEVPSVTLIEYELEFGVWVQALARLANTAIDFFSGGLDPYTILYNGNATGFEYNLPLLIKDGDKIRSISNSWGKTEFDLNKILGGSGEKASSTLGNIAGKAMGLAVGVLGDFGTEDVQMFTGTSPETITITFPLYNTVSISDAYNNYLLVSLLTFQNLKTRNTFLTYIPPKIYKVKTQNCLGGIDWPAAYVENLEIISIGTTRELSEYKGNTTILTPEAYKISITLKQLVATSSNTFAGAIGSKSVNVIGSITNVASKLATNGIVDAANALKEADARAAGAAGAVPANGGNSGIWNVDSNGNPI
jgi:hypothetical protein